jgi:hypothetical protein
MGIIICIALWTHKSSENFGIFEMIEIVEIIVNTDFCFQKCIPRWVGVFGWLDVIGV